MLPWTASLISIGEKAVRHKTYERFIGDKSKLASSLTIEKREKKMREDLELMQGAVDLHIHSAPSLFPRLVDHAEAAEGARKLGMKAVVLKEHHGYTSDRMYFVRKLVPGIEVYGGVVLNNAVGGINPFAAEAAINLGAKIVWFPTLSAKNHLDQMGAPEFGPSMKQSAKRKMEEKPITVFDEKGHLIPEVYDVIDLVAAHDIMLATGHLSIPEARAVIKAAKKRKVQRLYLNHPEYIINGTIEEQKELADLGAFIEHLAIFMYPMWPTSAGLDGIVEMIKAVGPERTVLATDLGQVHNPPPWEGLRMFLRVLLEKESAKNIFRKWSKTIHPIFSTSEGSGREVTARNCDMAEKTCGKSASFLREPILDCPWEHMFWNGQAMRN